MNWLFGAYSHMYSTAMMRNTEISSLGAASQAGPRRFRFLPFVG